MARADGNGQPTLRRSVSLVGLVLYGLGTTIGAGVYALTGVVAGRAGTYAPAAFVFAALLALPSALSFAELASRFPRAGGEAVYVREGFGRLGPSVAVGMLVALAGLVSAATVSVGFVGYLEALVPVPRLSALALVVLAVGAVSAWGIRQSVWAAGAMTLVETAGLLAVVVAGHAHLGDVPARLAELAPTDLSAASAVAGAALLCFFAFLGFEDMVNVAEEVVDVRRTLPRAIGLTLGITTVLYALLTTVAVFAVPPRELAASDAPLALVFERCGGPAAVLGVIALFALLNGALVQVVKASRVLYGLAGEGGLPAVLGRVSPRTRTPLVATGVATAVAAALALAFPLATLAEITSVVTLTTFALANAALVCVKRREPSPPGAVVFPLWVPVSGCGLTGLFLVAELARRLP